MEGSTGPSDVTDSDSSREPSQVQLRDIIKTAQNLVSMLNNRVSGNVSLLAQGQARKAVQSVLRPQQAVQRPGVRQEMARSFPGFFNKTRGKRHFAPHKSKEYWKSFLVNTFLLDKQYEKTPKEELPLMLAGLGKRTLTISENMTHSEFSELLVSAYPRLANICGGWMLHKSAGGGGQRRLVVIPPDSHGYTGQQLKAVSGNGKYTLYISSLQDELDTVPLPPDAKEFENMPKAQCKTCKKMVPLQILPVHVKECKRDLIDLCYSDKEAIVMLKDPSMAEERRFSYKMLGYIAPFLIPYMW